MKARLPLAALAFVLTGVARAATFEESYELVRGEARQAYLRLEPVETWVKPEQRLPLTDPDVQSQLEPGARRQKAEQLLAALSAIQELQGRPGSEALSPARKHILANTIKLGLALQPSDDGVARGLYHDSVPGIPPPLSDPRRVAELRAQAASALSRASKGAGGWLNLPAAPDATTGAAGVTPGQLAALNVVPRARSPVSTKINDVPLPSLAEQALLAKAQRTGADADVRADFDRRYGAEGHVLHDAQRSWEESAEKASGPRRWFDKSVAFAIGIPDDAQQTAAWWWYSRDKAELSPAAKERASGDVALQAAMMIPIGRGVGIAAKAGELALGAETKAAALRIVQLQAKIDAKQALTRAESNELAELTKGKSDLIFHTTTGDNMAKIRDSARVAATTERFAYGSRRQITNMWRQAVSGVMPKDGLIVFQGEAARLFSPHAVKGGWSLMKRAAGQQITDGSGDVIITKAVYDADTKTLSVLEARMPTQGERRFILQSAGWAQARYFGRIVLLDGALTSATGFTVLPTDTKRHALQYVFDANSRLEDPLASSQ